MDSNLASLIREYGDRCRTLVPGQDFIPVDVPVVNGDESVNLINSILGDDTDYRRMFTVSLFDYLGGGYVDVAGNNYSAHILTMKTLSSPEFGSRCISAGDEIITTANNVGIINAAKMCGVIPVVLDVDLHTLLPNPVEVESSIVEGKTKAVILSCPNGNPNEGEIYRDIADEFGILFIEDIGRGFGGSIHQMPIGDFTDVSIYSFDSTLLGSAGVIVSKSHLFHTQLEKLMSMEVNSELSLGLGSNKLMYAYLASQMSKRDYSTSMRNMNWKRLYYRLSKHDKWIRFQKAMNNSLPSWSEFLITLKEPYEYKFTRNELMEFLTKKLIGCRPYVGNVFSSGAYPQDSYRLVDELVNSEYLNKNSFVIGCHPNMQEKHMDYIEDVFDEFFAGVNA